MNVPRTARLDFKLMDEYDAPLLFELDSDPYVMQHLSRGRVTSMQTIKEVFIPRMLAYRNEQQGWGLWQVTLIDSAAFIGWVLIRPMDFFTDKPDLSDIEIGWRFKRESWGKGYASEAAQAVADSIATQFQVRSLSATALKENDGSIKVMKKLGMQFVKDYVHCDDEGELPAVLYRKILK
jgi:RimJ/RimL family protein N-acetyltransferase